MKRRWEETARLVVRLQLNSDMRKSAGSVVGLGAVLSLMMGCAEPKEATDPGAIVREETIGVNRIAPPSRATSRTVRCGCDRDGDLHVQAPQGSKVTRPEDATYDAEAQIVLPADEPGRPLRQSKSLGFIGDNKLGESRTRGGPWNAPDALLPPHRHVEPRYGGTYFRPYYGGYYGRSYFTPYASSYGYATGGSSPPMTGGGASTPMTGGGSFGGGRAPTSMGAPGPGWR